MIPLFKKGMAMKTVITWLYILVGLMVVIALISIIGGKSNDAISIFENIFS